MKFKDMPKSERPGGDKFLQIGSGETVKVIFRGEIYEYFNRWVNGKSETVSADTPGAKRRYKVNAVVNDNGYKAKIYDFGPGVYEDMLFIQKQSGDITKQIVAINREGTGLGTEWKLMALGQAPTTIDFNSIKLHILDADAKSIKDKEPDYKAEDFGPEMPSFEEDHPEIPF